MSEARKQVVKFFNVLVVSKVFDFGGIKFFYVVNFNICVECKIVMGIFDYFR